jgi:hypothetical protein
MSNLLNTEEGRNLIFVAQRYLLQRRFSRFFKRNIEIDHEQWSKGLGEFDLATTLGQLNVAHDDELLDLYRLLGAVGGLSHSIADTEIHVNPSSGSDIDGTGSSDRPYASLWFLDRLPRFIRHYYRILIYSDIGAGRITLDHTFEREGSISFVGVGPAVEVLSGTAGAITGVASTYEAGVVLDLDTTPSALAHNYFIQMTSGADDGKAAAVGRVQVADDWIACRYIPLDGVSDPDTYRYIEPAVEMQVQSIQVMFRSSQRPGHDNSERTRVTFANLKIVLEDDDIRQKLVLNADGDTNFAFCQILSDSVSESDPFIRISSPVNSARPQDYGALSALSQSGVENLFQDINILGSWEWSNVPGMKIIKRDYSPIAADEIMYHVTGSDHTVAGVDCSGCVVVNNFQGTLRDCWFNQMVVDRSNAYLFRDTIDLPGGGDAVTVHNSFLKIYQFLIGEATNAFTVHNSKMWLNVFGGDIAGVFSNTVNGFNNYALCQIHLEAGWSGTLPTGAAVFWQQPGTPFADPFPGARNFVDDLQGGAVTRYS